jgi:hypothetical protein
MVKVCEIIKLKGYESDENYIEILELAYDQNKLGKNRALSKDKFIQKISIGSADNSLFKSLNPTTQKRTISLMSYRFLSQTAQVQCDVGQNPKPNLVIFDESKLNHYFISGFVDGEGSFYLGMSKDSKRSSG